MFRLIPSTLILLLCSIVYIAAFRFSYLKKWHIALLLLVICGLCLRLFAASDVCLHTWDEQYHALVAKHLLLHWLKPTLYEHPLLPYDYKNWTANHIWLHKQPVALWLIAISLKIFGIHAWAVRMPSVILSTVGILLVYDVGRYLKNEQTGFIVAFLFSIQGFIIELSAGRTATDHVDVIFMFFILLAVWLGVWYCRHKVIYKLLLIGISMGLALLTKWLPALIVLPIWILLQYSNKVPLKHIIGSSVLIIFIALLVFLPWQWYIFHTYPREAHWEYAYNARHFFIAVEGHTGGWFYYFDKLHINYGDLVFLPVGWFSYKTIRYRNPRDWIVFVWFWVPFIFFSIAATKMPAFTLIAVPAILFMTAECFIYFNSKSSTYNWFVKLVAWLLLLLPARYTLERLKPFEQKNDTCNKSIMGLMKEDIKQPIVIFNDSKPIETMFFNDCTAYSSIPDSATVQYLQREGYKVIVYK